MAIEIVSKNHYEKIFSFFVACKKQVRIITPFISRDMAKQLADIVCKNDIKCTLITRFKRQDFLDGVSSIHALQDLKMAGVDILALTKLHTKLYIVDDKAVIIGSANFTAGGFKNNHELSVMLIDESEIITEIIKYYDDLMQAIINSTIGIVTSDLIKEEIEEIAKLVQKMGRGLKVTSYKEFGAKIDENKVENTIDIVQELFKMDTEDIEDIEDIEETVWLKFEGVASDRFDNTEKYSILVPKCLGEPITCFPASKKPTSFKEGDYVYIAVLSKDKNNKAMPIIIARGRSHKFESNQIADKNLISEVDWIEQWPAYIILYDVEQLNTEIINGIKHSTLLNALQSQVYKSTINRNVSIEKLKESHLQKSSIRLTGIAKQFLDQEFDTLKEKYGVIEFY